MSQHHSGIAKAVMVAGGQVKLAQVLGVTQQFISTCLRRGYVPVRRAVEIEMMFGVPRRQLINPRLADLVDLPAGVE